MPGLIRCLIRETPWVSVMDISFPGHFFSPLFFITWRSCQDNLIFKFAFFILKFPFFVLHSLAWFLSSFPEGVAKIRQLEASFVMRSKKKAANAPVMAAVRKDHVKVPVRSAMYPPKEGDRTRPSP